MPLLSRTCSAGFGNGKVLHVAASALDDDDAATVRWDCGRGFKKESGGFAEKRGGRLV